MLQVGTEVGLPDGGEARVVEVTEEYVTLDANHELAGQALTFNVDVVKITKVITAVPPGFSVGYRIIAVNPIVGSVHNVVLRETRLLYSACSVVGLATCLSTSLPYESSIRVFALYLLRILRINVILTRSTCDQGGRGQRSIQGQVSTANCHHAKSRHYIVTACGVQIPTGKCAGEGNFWSGLFLGTRASFPESPRSAGNGCRVQPGLPDGRGLRAGLHRYHRTRGSRAGDAMCYVQRALKFLACSPAYSLGNV